LKILILSNLTSYTYNFRFEILKAMIESGHDVTVVCDNDDGTKQAELENLGCKMIILPFNGKGTNISEEYRLLRSYMSIVREIRPDIMFTFTIKMNLYGGLAARRYRIPYIPMITGLGELEKTGKLRMVLMFLHKRVMPKAKAVVFQNQANMDFFKEHGIKTRKSILVPGSGINLEKHACYPYPAENNGLKFAFIGRLTDAKGISEYLSMAEIEKKKHPDFTFLIAGLCDAKYRERVEDLHFKGVVDYLGQLPDTRDLLRRMHCLVLPTYHPEGLSNVLLETAATGRPAICTSRPGCREVVQDGVNGLYCEARNVDNLVGVVESFCAMPESLHKEMGLEGRRIAESRFDRNIVVRTYLEFLDEK
jgi:galacturonosyltransferase